MKFRLQTSVDEEKRIKDVIRQLVGEIRKQQERIKEFTQLSERKKHEEELFRAARQMAHDLRSPVEALRTVIEELVTIPEEKRTLIREATATILDITNDLHDR